MFPYLTFSDGTEVVYSKILEKDSENATKLWISKTGGCILAMPTETKRLVYLRQYLLKMRIFARSFILGFPNSLFYQNQHV